MAGRFAKVTGDNAAEQLTSAQAAALVEVKEHIGRLSRGIAVKQARAIIFARLPTERAPPNTVLNYSVDVPRLIEAEMEKFEGLIAAGDLEGILKRYPIRDTPVLGTLSRYLTGLSRKKYERAVRAMLIDDDDALLFVRGLFSELLKEIES